uniref:Secreted protein n=1 Tax=Rhipicephalus appendiculatus TaxID=34631 RepID=A0A131YHR7_RHIAP
MRQLCLALVGMSAVVGMVKVGITGVGDCGCGRTGLAIVSHRSAGVGRGRWQFVGPGVFVGKRRAPHLGSCERDHKKHSRVAGASGFLLARIGCRHDDERYGRLASLQSKRTVFPPRRRV